VGGHQYLAGSTGLADPDNFLWQKSIKTREKEILSKSYSKKPLSDKRIR